MCKPAPERSWIRRWLVVVGGTVPGWGAVPIGHDVSTATGTFESVWAPLPSCPELFRPQHWAAPVAVVAHEWYAPAVMVVTPLDEKIAMLEWYAGEFIRS